MVSIEALIYLDLRADHEWDKIYDAILKKEEPFEFNATKVLLDTKLFALLSEGYKVITLIDEDYPEVIKKTDKPPFVIWYKCKLEELSARYFAKLRTLSASHIDERVFVE